MPRSWVYDCNISNYDALIFYNALKKHSESFYYKPIAMAKREEIGTKFRYLCIALPKDFPLNPSHFADIEIYKPVMGIPYLTSLYRIPFDQMSPHRLPY